MPPELIPVDDGTPILLDKPILLMGRHQECDVQLSSRKVSRRHCCLAQVKNYLVIRDLGSTNGIRINGQKVREGSLYPGDEVTIGNFRFKVRWEGNNAHAPLPTAGAEARGPGTLSDENDPLEDADEPVPLDDKAAQPKLARPPMAARVPPRADPKILPDSLHLAPNNTNGGPGKQHRARSTT